MTRDRWHLQFLGRTLSARQAIAAACDGCTLGVRKDFILQTLITRIDYDADTSDTEPDWHEQQMAEAAERRRKIVDAMPYEDMDGLRGG